eukprot:scaffold249998_cov21-Tisochrysis_lutea.AAC.1
MQYRHTQLAGPRHILAACKGRSVFAHHLHACLRDFPQPPPGFHRCTNFCSSFACTCEVLVWVLGPQPEPMPHYRLGSSLNAWTTARIHTPKGVRSLQGGPKEADCCALLLTAWLPHQHFT